MDLPDQRANIPTSYLNPISGILSNPGRNRSDNEDYALAYIPDHRQTRLSDGCLFIVADGSGAWTAGEAARQVQSGYYEMEGVNPGDRLKMVLGDVNSALYERLEVGEINRGTTTLVAAVVRQNRLTVANVGNSRAYIIHDGQAQQITRDHDLLSERMHMGALSMEEVERAGENNRLTRCLGWQDPIEVDVFADIPVYAGDVILLCSDGLTHYVGDDQIALLVGTGDPVQDCRHLVNWAIRSGGEEDVTALVILLEDEVARPPEPTSPERATRRSELLPISEAQSTRRRSVPKFRAVKGWWMLLALVSGALLLLALFGSDGLNLIQPVASVEPADTPNLPTASIFPTGTIPQLSQTATQAEVEPTPTIERVLSPPPSTSSSGDLCVWPVEAEQTLYSIIRRFDLKYGADDSYYYFEACDLEQLTCSGEKVEIVPHSSILAGWHIIIPVDDAKACEQGEGVWVQADENLPGD